MLFQVVTAEDVPKMWTVVKCEDGFVKVWMTEEELFRKVLGDTEFERRIEIEKMQQRVQAFEKKVKEWVL